MKPHINHLNQRRDRDNLLYTYVICVVCPIFMVGWLAWYIATEQYQVILWWWIVILLSGLHISVWVHRCWSHRTWVPTKRWLNVLAIAVYSLFWMMPTFGFVANHRKHHRFSDTKDDPHSPYWQSRWKITLWPQFKMDPAYITDLLKDPDHVWFARYYWRIILGFSLLLLAIDPAWLAFYISVVAGIGLKSKFVNDLGHDDPVNKGPTNRTLWAWIYLNGEPWHRNHHDDPRDWRLGRKWWEVDFGNYAIWILCRLGLGRIKYYD